MNLYVAEQAFFLSENQFGDQKESTWSGIFIT